MASICPGFMGVAEIDGNTIRCTDFNINPTQDFIFYDHVIGLNDTVPTDSSTKGEAVGVIQTQKRIGRPSVASIAGGFSFPATVSTSADSNFEPIFNHAKYGTYFDIRFQYTRGATPISRSFTECRINQFTFSVTAGDMINISADVMAKGMDDTAWIEVDVYQTPEKFITWDKVTISATGLPSYVASQALEFSVNNNVTPIYTSTPNNPTSDFLPRDLRVGMQEVTGSITLYSAQGNGFLNELTTESVISLSTTGFSTPINVVFKPVQMSGVTGPIVVQIPFVGVDKAFGN